MEAQTPEWIWSSDDHLQTPANEAAFFRKRFIVEFEAREAKLIATGDDEIAIFLNGKSVGRGTNWNQPTRLDVLRDLRRGTNLLAVTGKNGVAGPAGVLLQLEVRSANMFGLFIVSDGSWLSSSTQIPGWEQPQFLATNWSPAVSLGKIGVPPWGNVLEPPTATQAESLTLLPGFRAELLKSAVPGEGSWICMTFDDRGRVIISPEKEEAPMLRITLDANGKVAKTEAIPCPLRGAMGLLYAHDSLYVNGRGLRGVGLYRLIDSNHNDQFDPGEERLLKNFEGDNEHGYHAVALAPDGGIYVLNGNHTKTPPGLAPDSPFQNYAEDLILPRQWDANGHAKGVLAPGGYILRTDAEGKEWRLICGGFRNAYDFDFAPNGDLFTFDSDMEWDIGAPWYRPTRIIHCVSGGEYGWRSGSGKWPTYYPDSLPSVVDIGLSSPTGVRFGARSHFPGKYRSALFAADWAYGKIYAIHLESRGATYAGKFETFLSGKPLAVTALSFGPDGAMYFIIGGWKIQSGLYRVSWVGGELARDKSEFPPTSEALLIRRKLESFHGKRDSAAVDFAWPYLASEDRGLRFASRVAIESQDLPSWKQRGLTETNLNASLTAHLALARRADRSIQPALLARAGSVLEHDLPEDKILAQLRVLQVCFTRMGRPDHAAVSDLAKRLSALYPAKSQSVNRELCQLLVYLDAPDVLVKTLQLLAAAPDQEDQMHYAFVLRNLKHGWTPEQRRIYFTWFNKALREYKGGASFRPYLINIRNEAIATLTNAEQAEFASLFEDRAPVPVPAQPRQFVREWTIPELESILARPAKGRSFTRGKEAFIAAQCIACHRVGREGGAVGPDLTGVSGRFNHRDLLENIVLPSKIISDRYRSYTITMHDGEQSNGCITEETEEAIVIVPNPMTDQRERLLKKEIASCTVSKISIMPEGLLNMLTLDEIGDLLAFIESDGNPTAIAFTKSQ